MTGLRSLRVRLVLSHVLVALLAGLVTVVVVRVVALRRWDSATGAGRRGGGTTAGQGFRTQFVDSVDSAVLVGVLLGLLVALVLGTVAAARLARPLEQLRAATGQLARGRYDVRVPALGTTELAGLADDIGRLAEQLERTEGRRARLIGEVAHEMRTPVTVTRGYAEAMLDGVLPADDSSLRHILDQTGRLERLADDLSSLSRAEEGRLQVRPVRGDLVATVRDAVRAVEDVASGQRVSFTMQAPDVLCVEHDPDRIAQVLTNLLTNAVRASSAGGEVTVRVLEPSSGEDDVRVEVVDHGVGLRPGEESAVFERFYRGHPGDRSPDEGRPSTGGSGVGLTIARSLARAHDGDLVAVSDGPGRGARFTLRLPARRGDVQAAD